MSLPPPTPPDADLRHFKSMPLDVARLRDSEIASEGNAEGFRCAVLLWCAAWHQLPAGSLPVDDATLARMSGLGRDMRGWVKLKAVALRGWREFDDGRLYHPVVSEKVIEAWNSSMAHEWARCCDRTRKENSAREKSGRVKLEMPSKPAPCILRWPEEFRRNSVEFPSETPFFPAEKGLKGTEGNESSSSDTSTDPAREAQRAGGARLARSPAMKAMREHLAELAKKKRMECP